MRHEFFKGVFQANQRKEGFACRWLDERRKEQEKPDRARWRNIWVVLNIFVVLVIAGAIVINWFPGLIPFPFLEK